MAVGSPLGLQDTVTTGVISALHRPVSTVAEAANQVAAFDAIQTDAALNAGSGSGGTVSLRRMTGPSGATIAYTIYRDGGRTQIWGNGTSGTFTVTGTGTGAADARTGYGRVPPQAMP